jgi:hypothetical protein
LNNARCASDGDLRHLGGNQTVGRRWLGCDAKEGEEMSRLDRYIEWMGGGRRTGRDAYALGASKLPKPVATGEWQLDAKFNVAEELLRDPSLKEVIKSAIAKGAEVVTWDK